MAGDYVTCERCNSQVYKTAKQCPACNHGMNGEPIEVAEDAVPWREPRPTGSAHITAAVIIGALAVVLSVISALMPDLVREYSWSDVQPNKAKYLIALLSNGLFGLAVVLWGVGQIIKAISFLPRGDR